MDTISMRLLKTLEKGKRNLGEDAFLRIRQYIVSQITSTGVFSDKSGYPDVYYSAFGLMLAYIFDIPIDWKKTTDWLDKQDSEAMDLIHYAAFIRCRLLVKLINKGKAGLLFTILFSGKNKSLEQFCSIPHNDPCSPYTRFIWLSLREDMRQSIKDKEEIITSLDLYRVSGGGYANQTTCTSATVNATAAALSVRGQLEGYKISDDVNYLYRIQDDSGGYHATEHTPMPDLLSTATSLFVLSCYGLSPRVSPYEFIEAHWLDSGGFTSVVFDETSDMEYTFYGLLALGTCS